MSIERTSDEMLTRHRKACGRVNTKVCFHEPLVDWLSSEKTSYCFLCGKIELFSVLENEGFRDGNEDFE